MSIRVEHLTHIYDKGLPTEQIALEDINFTVADGELLGVIGHTGSGKSTLLQHLNGLLKPSSGRDRSSADVDITAPGVSMVEIRKRIGLVFQYPEYQLFEETVAKDVAFGPKESWACPSRRSMSVCERHWSWWGWIMNKSRNAPHLSFPAGRNAAWRSPAWSRCVRRS